jgi:hypothetical protein
VLTGIEPRRCRTAFATALHAKAPHPQTTYLPKLRDIKIFQQPESPAIRLGKLQHSLTLLPMQLSLFSLTLVLALAGFGQAAGPAAAPAPLVLLTGSELKDWKVIEEMKQHGPVTLKDGVLVLGIGQPMTGVVYSGKAELPVKDYEASFEARRIEGDDFFAALTLPVRDAESFVTFVVGGWGGTCVGISSIQFQSADENATTNWIEFEMKKWYRFRVEVRENRLKGFVDDKEIFDADTTDKKLSLRFGEIEYCKPLGLATFRTHGEIKNLTIKPLPPAAR